MPIPESLDPSTRKRLSGISWTDFETLVTSLELDISQFNDRNTKAEWFQMLQNQLTLYRKWGEFWKYVAKKFGIDRPRTLSDDGFDLAFFFAGAQRSLVRRIAKACEDRLGEGKVYFDEWFQNDIDEYSEDMFQKKIYSDRTKMIVVCVSENDGVKNWTKAEQGALRLREAALRESSNPRDQRRYLTIRVGAGDLAGRPMDSCELQAREGDRSPEDTAGIILYRQSQINDAQNPLPQNGVAFVLPCIEKLGALSMDLCDCLKQRGIAVRFIDPLLPSTLRAQFAREALEVANVVVEWFQAANSTADEAILRCNQEIHELQASRPVDQRKPTLMWLPPVDENCSFPSVAPAVTGKRMIFESFKKEVLDAAVPPLPAGNFVVIGAARGDVSFVQQLVGELPPNKPRDPQYDELQVPPDFKESDEDLDARIMKALRRPARIFVLVNGKCNPTWINERLRAYEVFLGTAKHAPKLLVWHVEQVPAKPVPEFWPDDPTAEFLRNASAADVAAMI